MASTPPGAARGRVVGDGSAGPYSGISVLIGAHVSPAGGPANAVARGVERGCRSIQIYNQNPRAWKPRDYTDEEAAAFHEAMDDSDVDALLIHAVYLLNCASEDPEIREKSLASLTASLRAGTALGALAVVLHPGSALKDGGAVPPALERAAEVITEALADSETCPLLLEDTAGAGNTLGRSFEELAELLELAGGDERLRVCLDSCHLLACRLRRPHHGPGWPGCWTRSTRRRPESLGALHINDPTCRSARTATATQASATASRRRGLRRVPLRAALRGAAVRVRGARRRRQGRRGGGHPARRRPARSRGWRRGRGRRATGPGQAAAGVAGRGAGAEQAVELGASARRCGGDHGSPRRA